MPKLYRVHVLIQNTRVGLKKDFKKSFRNQQELTIDVPKMLKLIFKLEITIPGHQTCKVDLKE